MLAGVAALFALVLALFFPTLRCLESCHVDYAAVHEGNLGRLEPADARLNTWILAWVQRSLLHDPAGLYDANIFHPALGVLTQSEHMLAEAVTLLPVRALGGDPVAVHQAGMVLSALLLALTSFALLRGLGASAFAAWAGGAAAIAMPWRLAEVSHLQLLSAQWFPLVWLLTARVAAEPRRWGSVALLSLALGLQLLSSFYLAYYLAASFALLVLALWWCGAVAPRGFAALAAALALPALLFVLSALPYLEWKSSVGFLGLRPIESVSPAAAAALIAPKLELGWRGRLPLPVSFEVPLAPCLFAVFGVLAAWRAGVDSEGRRLRGVALGLAALVAVAAVLSLGRELELGGARVLLPGGVAARWIPGYDNLRNPLRWTIAIGLAIPVLAGLGIAALERRWAGPGSRTALRAGVLIAWASSLPWVVLPVRDAWEGQREQFDAYRALDALGSGAVVEVPWPPISNELESRYVLASTLHWRGLLNGISGYVPPSYLLLHQIAQDLPDPRAIARMQALSDVRFVVLHVDALSQLMRAPWEQAVKTGRLGLVWSDDATWIVELPRGENAARLQADLVSPAPRALTLTGLPRTPIVLAPGDGSIEIPQPLVFHVSNGNGLLRRVPVTLRNTSGVTWPGLDVQTEGLVRLRYAFLDADGGVLAQESVPLADDIPPRRALTLRLPMTGPGSTGSFSLRAELVQVQDGDERVLGLPPALLPVSVGEIFFEPGSAGIGGGSR